MRELSISTSVGGYSRLKRIEIARIATKRLPNGSFCFYHLSDSIVNISLRTSDDKVRQRPFAVIITPPLRSPTLTIRPGEPTLVFLKLHQQKAFCKKGQANVRPLHKPGSTTRHFALLLVSCCCSPGDCLEKEIRGFAGAHFIGPALPWFLFPSSPSSVEADASSALSSDCPLRARMTSREWHTVAGV